MRKIKVLHIFKGMDCGGAQALVMNIYRYINRNEYEFHFAVHSGKEGYYDKEICMLGGKIIQHTSPKQSVFKFIKELDKTIQLGEYDVIHSHVYTFSGLILKLACKRKIPIRLAHSHTNITNKSSSLFKNIYNRYTKYNILKYATKLLACSKDAAVSLYNEKSLNDNRLVIIPNGIVLDLYKNTERYSGILKEELGLPKDAIIIGHVGSFRKPKNHKFVLDIFERYEKTNKNAYLVLVGNGELKNEIEESVKNKKLDNKVIFLGNRNDIPKIMSSFDVFLFPSLYEGLGIVLIEAQASGTPCVVSKGIPLEADMNLNLIKYLDLNDSKQKWIQEIDKYVFTKLPKFKEREYKIRKNGYDINYSLTILKSIYSTQ